MRIEVRQEAVQQALAALKNHCPKPSLPMPSKRSSVFNRSPERGDDHDSGKFCTTFNNVRRDKQFFNGNFKFEYFFMDLVEIFEKIARLGHLGSI
jgi:hypothetical protein